MFCRIEDELSFGENAPIPFRFFVGSNIFELCLDGEAFFDSALEVNISNSLFYFID